MMSGGLNSMDAKTLHEEITSQMVKIVKSWIREKIKEDKK